MSGRGRPSKAFRDLAPSKPPHGPTAPHGAHRFAFVDFLRENRDHHGQVGRYARWALAYGAEFPSEDTTDASVFRRWTTKHGERDNLCRSAFAAYMLERQRRASLRTTDPGAIRGHETPSGEGR